MAITEIELAEKVKSKYPQYRNIDDTELVSLVLDRYPEYSTQLGEKEYSKNLLTNSAKTLVSGGVQAAINAGAGVSQSYSLLLGDKSDTSEEAVEEYASQRRVKQRKGGSRMAKGKILAHRKRKNEVIQSLNENAHRLRTLANSTDERFNIDPEFANSFGGQVLKGFGQMVGNIGAAVVGTAVAGPVGGVAAAVGTIAPQMVSEAVSDSEATLGKSYMDMTEEEKEQVALATAGYATLGTALEFAPVARIPWVKNFLRGKTKVAAGVLKSPSVRREIARGFAAEGFTEAAQGQLLDSLARATFDDDRELMSWDVLRQRFNEFAVGGIVGGGTSGGIATIQKAAQGELFKPKETKEVQTDGITKEVFEVTYTDQNTGQSSTVEIDAENQEEATRIAGERLVQSAVEGTIVARPKPAPEPVAEEVIPEAEQAELQDELQEELQLTESDFAPDEEVSARAAPVGVKQFDFTDQEAEAALPKKEKVKFNKHKTEPIQKGAVRLNLNSKFKKEGVAGSQFVQTLHPINKDGKPNYGKAHSYGRSFTLKNATFSVNPLARAVIGYKVKNKYPMASVDGEVVNTDGSLEGEVLSFNPFRENAFVDSQGRPVKSADEVTVYGTKAYARGNIQYADTTESVSKDELITLARRGKKYVHPKFHPQGVKVTLSPEQIKQIESSPELPVIGTQPEVTAGTAPFTAPQKAPLSHVEQSDIIDMDALIDEIVENDIPVWFWYADQLGEGDFNLPSGGTINLDAGPSYALQPANRAAGRVWASSKSVTEINNKISQLKYTDKNGKEQTGYIFLVSGSPDTMFLFNKQAFLAFYQNAFQEKQKDGTFELRDFSEVKKEILASRPTKLVKDTLNNHGTLESLINSSESRPFIEALLAQRGKSTPLAEYLKSKGFFDIENSQLRDGFYKDNNFQLNDILLVVKPTKAVKENIAHKTYTTPVYGEVVGVPDKTVDAYLLIPDSVRKNKDITMDPPQAAQVVAPYGARVTTIKKVVNSQQALRAVKRLRQVIEDSPDGFTVDTSGEFATGGYIVAPEKSTERIINKEDFNQKSLTQYIIDNQLSLNREGAMLGGWYNSENGEYVLDVVFAIDNEQDAIDIAIWGDQDAFFNLDTFTEIRTKDDNKNPKTPQGDTRTASEILSRKPAENLGEYSSQRRRNPRGVRQAVPGQAVQDITAQVAPTDPGGTFNQNTLDQFITKNFLPLSRKIGSDIVPNYTVPLAQYNATQGVIEYNPAALAQRDQQYVTAAMREEMIHAAMSKVILKKSKGKNEGEAFKSFMESLGKSLTPEQRTAISQVYQGLETDAQFGAEYSRAAIQQLLYGNVTESFITRGPAFAKIKALLKSVQAYIAKTFKADVTTNPEAAAIIVESARLLQSIDANAKFFENNKRLVDNNQRLVEQKIVDKAMAYSQDVNPNAEVTSEQVAESGKPPSEKKLNVNFARKYLFTVSSLLNSIHPRLKKLVRDYYGAIQGEVLDYQKRVAPFFKKYRGIKNADDRKRLKQLLSYSPIEQEGVDPLIEERDALLRKYDLFNDYQLEIRPVLNELYNRLGNEGIMIGFLEQYFPRSIKDLDKVKNRAGKELRDAFREFIKARNERIQDARTRIEEGNPQSGDVQLSKETTIQIGNPKTAALEAQQWDQFTRGFNAQGRRNLPGNFLSRSQELEIIPDNLLDAYEDPGAAMERYIYNAVTAIQTTRLMGSKFANVPEGLKVPPASELGLLIQELRANGEISMEDADGTVPDIFAMILSPVQVENIYFQLARSFGYGTLLVEFTSTLSQLYDLPFIMLDNGIFGTAVAAFGPRLKGDDFGIDVNQVSVEFASDNRVLEKAVRLGLKATGFTKLDQVMKETNLTANYNRYRKLARGYFKDRNSAKSKKFVAELTSMGYSEQEQTKLIADLKAGNRDSAYIRTLLFNKLSETQPLTKAEMALGIVNNPNLRFTVAMKSFMIKQLNFVKDRMVNEFIDGVRTGNARKIKKASSDLALLMTFMLLIGLPVDALKDFLAGRLGYMSDYLFNGVFRIAGISRYTSYQFRKEGAGAALRDYVTPVAIQQFVDATSELGRVMRGERAITESKFVTLLPFSDVINRIFGFQKGRESKEYLRRVKEGERPLIVPPGAL